jgi:CRP-like cAMP-binding protein
MGEHRVVYPHRNQLLASLAPDDLAAVEPRLEPFSLQLRVVLELPNKPVEFVYFLEAGLASIVASAGPNRGVVVGIVGRDGMSGSAVFMGDGRSPHLTYIQVTGSAFRIRTNDLREAIARRPAVHALFLRYAQTLMIQATYTALANARSKIEARLARWILMAHDRQDGDRIALTHEALSLMLGVRRPGVTEALHDLESRGLIRPSRGIIMLQDREGLEKMCSGTYGQSKAEYDRLIGPSKS